MGSPGIAQFDGIRTHANESLAVGNTQVVILNQDIGQSQGRAGAAAKAAIGQGQSGSGKVASR
jgi:hypothetical protein